MSELSTLPELESLARGFRSRYLAYDELTAQLRGWADAFPSLVRLDSIGQSAEGRDLWVLTVGRDPARVRPAVWVDGNMHASELCGSSVALAIAEDVIGLLLAPERDLHGLPRHVRATIEEVLFYVMPRMSPDGAEVVLTKGGYVRSSTRDERPNRAAPRWVTRDLDGDGLALLMRKQDPTGEFAELREAPGVLAVRTLEDEGPYFKVYPEGVIEGWDGSTIPSPTFLQEYPLDLNRNFPWSWAPEPDQVGAGDFPTSAPESRAVVEFVTKRPHIFAWQNLHTFGGTYIRPLGHEPDDKMVGSDRALYRQLERWFETLTGYPMVSGFEEFTYEPSKPLHGDLSDYAYHQRGCISYVCELWDIFRQIGMQRTKRFVDQYTHMTREDVVRLARWDAEHNAGRIVRPWRRVVHPQLGEVEVGGLDTRIGVSNPPYERVAAICEAHAAAFMRVAALAPRVVIARAEAVELGAGATRLDVVVENRGYLPTFILESSKQLAHNEPLWLDIRPTGCELVSPADAHREIGHLDGWGRGLFDGTAMLAYVRSRGTTASRTLRVTLTGHGSVLIRAGSCRTGWIEQTVRL